MRLLRENGFSTASPLKSGFNLNSKNNSSDPLLPKCMDLYLCDLCGKDFDNLRNVLVSQILIFFVILAWHMPQLDLRTPALN